MKPEDLLFVNIARYEPEFDASLLQEALTLCKKAHDGQIRSSGAPYYTHPLEVALILTDLRLDLASIITALLHDTVEDTFVTIDYIKEHFGPTIAYLVDGVTKLTKLELQSETTRLAENFRKLVLAMSKDIRVLLVKLADRLHNMRTLSYVPKEKRDRIAKETLDIYVPLTDRIGLQSFKDELEELSFFYINPTAHKDIVERLTQLYTKSDELITYVSRELHEVIEAEGLNCRVSGRKKTPFAIWEKMQRKNVAFEQLSDIIAFRILVDNAPQCYQILGILHGKYPVVPRKFKDYISTPKQNHYQSLHTTILGPQNQRIEIQIRTEQMQEVAELGVAAHWQYKKPGSLKDGKQYAWVKGLLDILDQDSNPEEFFENTQLEMFSDQVFCFTPKGEVITLPKGATSIDFAYALHSDIGDKTIGVRINGKQMPLRTVLNTGDQIEIITSNNHTPSPAWEKFVVTGKARAHIRRFVKNSLKNQYIELGRSLVAKSLKSENIEFSQDLLHNTLQHLKIDNIQDYYLCVGEGTRAVKELLAAILLEKSKDIPVVFGNNKTALSLKGLIPGMAVHIAECCHPLPGDRIVGVHTKGKGVSIHTKDCEKLTKIQEKSHFLELTFEDSYSSSVNYVGRLKVIFYNKPGALAGMTTAISRNHGNILNLRVTTRTPEFWELVVDIEVHNLDQLKTIIASLRANPIMNSVERG